MHTINFTMESLMGGGPGKYSLIHCTTTMSGTQYTM